MAGGIGSRFWPMSRTDKPKQFLDFLGTGKTLIQQTFERVTRIVPKENVYIVTNTLYKELTLEQLTDITEKQVICEPSRRNTAPCIAYANHKIKKINPNANILVAPADHLIIKEDVFADAVQKCFDFASKNDALITMGITPTRPDTGYGYIQFINNDDELKKVKTFTEKPDHDLAVKFIESGEFSWNSGMFIWNINSISKAFENHLPNTTAIFAEGEEFYNTDKEADFIEKAYSTCKDISIDYGIMEKAENVFVMNVDIGWSDLGTWGSVYTHLKRDENENAKVGKHVMLYDTTNCMINVPKDKLVVIQGLDDYIVVEANNTLLICKKSDEQKIKQFVQDVKIDKGEKFV
jgi:mannose-1-phosphate guanylyltransferase